MKAMKAITASLDAMLAQTEQPRRPAIDCFWQRTPEWRRKRERQAALDAAREEMDKAGRAVLIDLRMGMLDTEIGRDDRKAYLLAHQTYEDAHVAWDSARQAFEASPAGKARARWHADPIGATMAESEAG